MAVSPARRIAFDVLHRVATKDAYADELLHAALDSVIRRDDAALATELTLGVLQWQRLLDFQIEHHLLHEAKKLDTEVQVALRLAMYQLIFLDRIPARAAIYESVELVKRARKRSAASLVNAVLQKAAQDIQREPMLTDSLTHLLPNELLLADRLGLLYSHPTWLVERWLSAYGEERTRALLAANNRARKLSCWVQEENQREAARESLRQAGCFIAPGRLLREAWTLSGGHPSASKAVQQGWVAIQDEASQAVAHLLGIESGNTVLDLCAAPGGKTLLLARAAGPEGHVVAGEIHKHRLREMAERFEHAAIRNVECVELDATQPLPFERGFDRILADAPCSGTGTLSRHPEIRWRLRAEDLTDLHARQVKLLQNALSHLAPGGRLVYSTCSLEPEENEFVVAEALSAEPQAFRIITPIRMIQPVLMDSVPAESLFSPSGFFRTFPPEHGTDGFFAATIERGGPRKQ
jgi:16S rRNA (cytosine967-C5)-methyltransferase